MSRLPYPVYDRGGKPSALPAAARYNGFAHPGVTMRLLLIPTIILLALAPPLPAADITPAGKKLTDFLDALDVEHLWDPGKSVAWKTGKPLDKQAEVHKGNTHCSAFVAAACFKADIYILRPPEHPTKLLANAQADWLAGAGAEKGWKPVASAVEAQRLANQGDLVIGVFKEANPEKSGHIAFVRPSDKSEAKVREEGPQICQAGATNANSTALAVGFKHHKGAWPGGVRFYVHPLALK
jgi:hypothetical protein